MPACLSARCRPAVPFVLAAALWLLPLPAAACKYVERPMAEKIAAAPVIAIGHIETIENGLATLRVQQAIKGIEAGQETITFEAGGRTSCHHRFTAGQRWLYMGASYMEGSILLEDEFARRIPDNIAFVEAEFSVPSTRQSQAMGGVLSPSCAPWDGAAMALKLEDGTGARIYSGLQSIGDTPQAFSLDNVSQRGNGQVILCPEEGKPCVAAQGVIYLLRAEDGQIEGRLEIKDGEHTRFKIFRVREDRTEQHCG